MGSSLQYLSGVGPVRARALAKLRLLSTDDLLFHLPRTHDDRRLLGRGLWGAPGTAVAVAGVVERFEVSSAGKDLMIGRAVLTGEGPPVEALWFRRRSYRYDPYEQLKKHLTPGARIAVYGPWQRGPRGPEIRVEDQEVPWDGSPSPHMDRWAPVYDLTEGVNGRWLRGLAWRALDAMKGLPDPLPEELLRETGLADLAGALRHYHFPPDLTSREKARQRLAFDEFFFLELALAQARRRRIDGPPAALCRPTRSLLSPFRRALGFDFTPAQKRVINEVFEDMERSRPMNRLLMGEVGSGKTVVAVSALLLAVESGRQAALMAPTEILAEQHALGLGRLLKGLPVRWALFTGGRPAARRKADREALAAGEIQIAVGTHALLEEEVGFKNLALAVIDEQHRFGVLQRAALGGKGVSPHVLLMTATPIPRTLALTLYGDLAVSVIDELPPGRPGIATRWTGESDALAGVRRAVAEGRQAYVVFPLIEESERVDLRAVLAGWKQLQSALPGVRVGLLHGRMKSAEKEAAMAAFVRGETQVLAATPVIEVGIDVPNASALVVMNAERFGLAQLHQLRGRIGRGIHFSHCFLVSGARSPEVEERLRLLCRISNGFALAEEDLRRRGPGEFLGEAQHGLPEFRAGNLVTDGAIISQARARAFGLVERDPLLSDPRHSLLAAEVGRRFADRLPLGRVA